MARADVEMLERGYDLIWRVLVLAEMQGRGRHSGVRTEMKMAQLWSFRSGRAVRMVVYYDPQEALAAAGLAQ